METFPDKNLSMICGINMWTKRCGGNLTGDLSQSIHGILYISSVKADVSNAPSQIVVHNSKPDLL